LVRPFGGRLTLLGVVGRKAIVNADIPTYRPSELVEPLLECHEACLHSRIILGIARQHADPSYLLGLLRARRERPGRRRAAEQRYERAPFHSITSSARASKVGGRVHRKSTRLPYRAPFRSPGWSSPCWNATRRAFTPGSSSASPVNTPIRRICSVCCARAASGQAAAAPPSSDMNVRRFIRSPRRRGRAKSAAGYIGRAHVCPTARPSDLRAGRAPAGMPRGVPSLQDHPRHRPSTRRSVVSARSAARAPRAARPPPRRRAAI